ncbi:MAG TPA: alkaline phosphatase family protein [Candidatus Deferrimicrobium sp.]|nr:alkaline phosphatase family protein [Candidatus Deferrimicrobium sp.]
MTMKRREFIKNTGLLTAASIAGPFMNFAAHPNSLGKMIVLGFDGMDPAIVNRLMQNGELPNMQKLAQMGTFTMMHSSIPPQSPVAWGSFITGSDPGAHGIFDFLARDPKTYAPKFSQADTIPADPAWTLKLGKYRLPLKSAEVVLKREGKAFWDYLEERDVEATIFKIPNNYPPSKSKQRTISGMGTPGLQDGYGFYTIYTSDEQESMKDISPNYMYYAYIDENNTMKGEIEGPINELVKDEEKPKPIVPFRVYVDYKHKTARIDIQDKEILISEGEYSDWVEIDFPLIAGISSVTGMVKFYLLEIGEKFRLYISPIHISPANPALPICTPPSYSKEIVDKVGLFHTINLPADTHALSKGAFTVENFIVQSMSVFNESRKIFQYELERFLTRKSGLLFFYFSSLDQGQHMFWALKDKEHPFYHPEESLKCNYINDELYRQHDQVLGELLKKISPGVKIMVMSDHGFAPYRREFHLGTWLFNEGYLKLNMDKIDTELSLFDYVDWGNTKAYGLGLNGLYLNLAGREGEGSVKPQEKRKLLEEIKAKLEQFKDPKNGVQVVTEAFISEDHYSKDFLDRAPDIIVGCNSGYRISGASALGTLNPQPVTDNMDWWSGDHCMNPRHVPASFIANFKINKQMPHIMDIAPTILKCFGIENPPTMRGKSLI